MSQEAPPPPPSPAGQASTPAAPEPAASMARAVARTASPTELEPLASSDIKSDSGAGRAGRPLTRPAALCPGASPGTPISTSSASTTGSASRNAFTWSGLTSSRSTRAVASPESSCILSTMTAATIAASLASFVSGRSSMTFSTPSRDARRRSRSNSFLSCSIENPSRSRTAQTVFRLMPRARAVAEMLIPSAAIRTAAA